MKLKLDFIANSSSAAYIMSFKTDDEISDFEDFIECLDRNPEYDNEGVRIWQTMESKKELYEYATERPYDWASKAMAARPVNMEQEAFDESLKAINNGHTIILVAVDYNACEEFASSKYYSDMLAEIW